MESKKNTSNTLKSLFYLLYFLILTAERVISLIQSFSAGAAFANKPESYMTVLNIIAIAGGWAYLIIKGGSVFGVGKAKTPSDFIHPTIAAGVILAGGMVHSFGTVAPLQFVSYGFLLLALALHTADCVREKGEAAKRWLSFAYLTAFSMAIPVVYHSEFSFRVIFVPLEVIGSLAFVTLFTLMAVSFLKKDSLLSFCPWVFIVTAVLDGALVVIRWSEEINWFLLIFACVTVVLGVVGKIMTGKAK